MHKEGGIDVCSCEGGSGRVDQPELESQRGARVAVQAQQHQTMSLLLGQLLSLSLCLPLMIRACLHCREQMCFTQKPLV